MALTIQEDKGTTKDLVTADRRLWLNAEGQAVEDGDPEARSLLCGAGQRIPRKAAEAAGVTFNKPAEKAETKPAVKGSTKAPKAAHTSKKKGK